YLDVYERLLESPIAQRHIAVE
ncbi:MAG: hypothetical protein QOJ37_3391, partial [Pseudonocardiales bacterium]|nr:hypothetical protein [Pseudonocardiales bacterium]